MNIVVTGAAGFIGGHLARTLAADGHRLSTIDMESLAESTCALGSVREFRGDIRDAALVSEALGGAEVVFHQAALASVPESFADPAYCMSVNAEGSAVILEQARIAGVRRVVMASTSAIYGDDPTPLKHEALAPAPRSPYAVSKLSMELLGDIYARELGLEVVALRYFNVFGPGQPADGGYAAVIPAFFAALRSGKPVQIYGDGSQTRAFVHVSDVVRANLLAATVDFVDPGLQVMNIASSEVTSITDVLTGVASALGVQPRANHHPWREGDIRDSRADISMAQRLLGFEPVIAFADGITAMASES